LCREIGEVQYAYLQSLHTFTQDWSYRNTEAGLDGSVARLKAWYEPLDADLQAAVAALTDDDLRKTVDRGGYAMPLDFQLDAYPQALLIFFGKAAVYLRAMNKPLPPQFQEYID
jgi:hypothetical protein